MEKKKKSQDRTYLCTFRTLCVFILTINLSIKVENPSWSATRRYIKDRAKLNKSNIGEPSPLS